MATLDEPYLVTSYGISPDQLGADKTANERFKLGVTSVIYRETKASKAGKQQSRRPIAVNTIQGNGIHLVDVGLVLTAFLPDPLADHEILDCLPPAFRPVASVCLHSLADNRFHMQSRLSQH